MTVACWSSAGMVNNNNNDEGSILLRMKSCQQMMYRKKLVSRPEIIVFANHDSGQLNRNPIRLLCKWKYGY